MGTTTMFLDLSFGVGPMVFGLVAAGSGFAGAFAAAAAIAAAGAIGTAWVAWPRRRPELQPGP